MATGFKNGAVVVDDAATSRTNLGVVIGTNVEAWSAVLDAVAAGTYTGATSITTLGTIATGIWSATTIAVNKGGTGQTSYTDGQLLVGQTSGNTLAKTTLTAGSNVTITNGSGAITIASTPGTLGWTVETTTSRTMVAGNGYFSNNAGQVTFTLPTTMAVGDTFEVRGLGAGGWKVGQNASQLIHAGSSVTTTGTGGSLASTNQYDGVNLVCAVANTTLIASILQGNLTVV